MSTICADGSHRSWEHLEVRVQALEAERGVFRLLDAYGPALDYGDEDGWVDLFTDDGIFEIVRPGERPPVRAVGRDQLRAIVDSHSRAPERFHKHCTVNSRVEVEGGAASAVSYFLLVIEHETWPVVRAFGRYVDRLICCGDHRWRFEHRLVEIESERPDIPRLMNSRGLGRRGGDASDER